MMYLKLYVVAAAAAVALLVVGGVGTAAANTVLCAEKANPCPAGKAYGVDTEIEASLSGTKWKITTTFKTIECAKSSITTRVTSTGETMSTSLEDMSFEECNCTVKVLAKGTLDLEHIAATDNATPRSTGTEITTSCSTIFGNVHCIYKTNLTDLGTLEGGNPAKLKVSVTLPRVSTSELCNEESVWEAEYGVTSPKPLYVESEAEPLPPTVLCTEKASPCPAGKSDGVGTEIKASLSGTSKITTTFKTIECAKSSITAKVTTAGEGVGANVEGMSFEECNCTVKVLAKGTLDLEHIAATDNATPRSTGTRITTSCSTIFGNVHCIYKTAASDLGALEGGNPAKIKVSTELPRASTSTLCDEESVWEAEYEVSAPKPLYVEPEVEEGTVLCTEEAVPCAKADGINTEIKTSLVSGGKSKLTTPYNNIECSKSSINSKVTSIGKTLGASVENLTFEECNCEVKVLAKGLLELEQIASTNNATVKSTGTEVTTKCETIFGPVHCIYKTEATDLGTLEGGSPAKVKVSGANIPRLATDTRCNEGSEGAKWDVEYEVTSPKPLFIEPK